MTPRTKETFFKAIEYTTDLLHFKVNINSNKNSINNNLGYSRTLILLNGMIMTQQYSNAV